MNSSLTLPEPPNSTSPCIQIAPFLWILLGDLTSLTSVQIIFCFLYSIVFILGVCGNLLVILAILKYRTLRTVRNVFILNLSISDFLVSLISLPISGYVVLFKTWIFGTYFCRLIPALQGATIIISTYTLASIAIDRFILLVKINWRPITNLQAIAIIATVWTCAAAVCSPIAVHSRMIDGSFYAKDGDTPFCGFFCDEVAWPRSNSTFDRRKAYGVTLLIVQFVIPLTVISACYACIIYRINNTLAMRKGSSDHNPTYTSVPCKGSMKKSKNATVSRRTRTNRMQMAMVALFAASWLPQVVHNILQDISAVPQFILDQPYLVAMLCHMIAMTSTFWNPILYGFMNTGFRHAFMDLLAPMRRRVGAPGSMKHRIQDDLDTAMPTRSRVPSFEKPVLNGRCRTTRETSFCVEERSKMNNL